MKIFSILLVFNQCKTCRVGSSQRTSFGSTLCMYRESATTLSDIRIIKLLQDARVVIKKRGGQSLLLVIYVFLIAIRIYGQRLLPVSSSRGKLCSVGQANCNITTYYMCNGRRKSGPKCVSCLNEWSKCAFRIK